MPENPVYFDLTLPGGNVVQYDSGNTYSINDAGVLKITTRHSVEQYSPAGWWRVQARPVIGDPDQ